MEVVGAVVGMQDGDEDGPVGDPVDGFQVVGLRVGFTVGRRVGGSDGTTSPAISSMCFLNFRTFKDPSPDTGSQPGVAWKP